MSEIDAFIAEAHLVNKKNPINPTYAKPVVTYRTKRGHFLYPFIFTRTPTLPMHTNTYTHARTRGRSDSTLYHPPLVHLKSPLSPLTTRLPRNDPDAPSLLTVQGVSGDLTSHGGMQGAFFTFLSRRASGGEA